jgi:hypothetical protein
MPEDLAMHPLLSTAERLCATLVGLVLLPLIYWWVIVGAFRGGNDCYECHDGAVAAMGIFGLLSVLAALGAVGFAWVVAATGKRRWWVWFLAALAMAGLSIALQSVVAPLR